MMKVGPMNASINVDMAALDNKGDVSSGTGVLSISSVYCPPPS